MQREKDKHEFSFTEDGGDNMTCRFIVAGKVTINNASFMEHKLKEQLEAGRVNIFLDMSRVTFFSSAGIRAVLDMFKKSKALGGKLQIVNPSDNVRNVIGMTALDALLLK